MAITFTGTPTTPVITKAYTFTPTISGGTAPYTVTATPALPSGYTLDATTGKITATAVPDSGEFKTTLRVTDSTADTPLTADLSIDLTPIKLPTIVNTALPTTEVGVAVSWTPDVVYGNGSATSISVTASTLPAGLTVADTGVISGTPTKAGSYSITATATDGTNTNTQTLTMTVTAALSVSGTLPKGYVISTYSFTPTATGGKPPYTWTVSALPTGLDFDTATGAITGTFATPGSYPVSMTATDALNSTATLTGTLIVEEAVPLLIEIPGGFQNIPMNYTLTADDVSASATYAVTGTLPTGLTFNTSTGTFTGTPKTSGEYPLTITITDGTSTTTRYSVLVITGGSIPAGSSVHPYDEKMMVAIDRFDNLMLTDTTSPTNQTLLGAQILLITNLLLRAPSMTALTLIWAKHSQYSTSFFGNDLFTTVVNTIPSARDAALVTAVQQAFHAALTNPDSINNLDNLIRITRQPRLVAFIESKLGRLVG